jgi:hypothetical protein
MHVGYYLLDKGLTSLEQEIKPRFTLREHLSRFFSKNPLLYYLGAMLFFTFGFAALIFLGIGPAASWFLATVAVFTGHCGQRTRPRPG